jgi:hypothetical protein
LRGQGDEYEELLRFATERFYLLCTPDEAEGIDKWYVDYIDRTDEYDFETYEPDVLPSLIEEEQRIRETGNAFVDFARDVFKIPTVYTEAFSGARPRGSSVGNWLERDPNWVCPKANSYLEIIESFRQAFITQTELRKQEERQFNKRADSVMKGHEDFIISDERFLDEDEFAFARSSEEEESESNILTFDEPDQI